MTELTFCESTPDVPSSGANVVIWVQAVSVY